MKNLTESDVMGRIDSTTSTKDVVICDIDGTLANPNHRRHYVTGEGKKDWKSFFRVQNLAPVKEETKDALTLFGMVFTIHIVTARPESERERTVKWLDAKHVKYDELHMTRTGKMRHIADCEAKRLWLHSMGKEFKSRILVILDDRTSVVNMWREEGLVCWQVEDANF